MGQNSERKPESYLDEFDTVRYKWTDASAEDLHKIKDMMYNQARKVDETLDGRSWSKLFVSNGVFKMNKSIMTLFQDKYNVHYGYEAMRSFLKQEFNIDSPLPRHEKIDYPYEDHPDNVMAEIQNRVSREALDPNTLGKEYDIDDPKNADAIARAVAEAEQDLATLDFEALAAEQLMVTEAADMEALDTMINNDLAFEELCIKKDIDPFQYAKLQFELRGSAPAISFADAMSQLESFDKTVLDRYIARKENEAKGIFEETPLDSILQTPEAGAGGLNSDIPDLTSLDPGQKPNDQEKPAVAMDMADTVKKMKDALDDKEQKGNPVNEYMRQIMQQDRGKSGAKEDYNPNDENERKPKGGHGGQRGAPSYSMNIRMPFEERIASMVTGAVSYPGSLYRNYRDSAASRKRVVQSRDSLLRDIHHVSSNFGEMDDSQKMQAVKRLNDTVNDYVRDVQDAGDTAKATGDKKLKDFLVEESKKHGPAINEAMSKCAEKHPELEELKKYMEKMMDTIKSLIRSVLAALTGGKRDMDSSPSPSP